MEIRYIFSIMFAHWVADFINQTDEMAKGKSTSMYWLTRHVLTYSVWMLLTGLFAYDLSLRQIIPWIVVNGVLHFMIDYVTSRISARLYKEGDVHNFFVIIGLDQFIHLVCLIWTFKLMVLR